MKLTAQDIIRIFGMIRLPEEGGYYTETYRSKEVVQCEALPARYDGSRVFSTVIYYLITAADCSKMHRVASDEIFCFHQGDPVTMLLLLPNGQSRVVQMGNDLDAAQVPQVVVPAGTYQGAMISVKDGCGFSLLSCIVAPGFEFSDFELGDRKELADMYPDAAALIRELT